MSDLHDQRVIKKSWRSKRLARSRVEAVPPPPARRTRSGEVTVHPRSEASVYATKTRSPSPPYGERDPEAPPPTRRTRRADALVPPCKRAEASVPAAPSPLPPWYSGPLTTRKVLRNREIIFPYSPPPPHCEPSKPTPRRNGKGKECKHDRSQQTPRWAVLGLEHYNNMNQGDEHEMVKAGVSICKFAFNTFWTHANFMAKRKGATSCVDLVPKYFFAELKMEGGDYSCVSCVKLNPDDIGGCSLCPQEIMHPACGAYLGAKPRPVKRAVGGLKISFSF